MNKVAFIRDFSLLFSCLKDYPFSILNLNHLTMRKILFWYYEYVIVPNLVPGVKIVCVANGEAENEAEDQNYPYVRVIAGRFSKNSD